MKLISMVLKNGECTSEMILVTATTWNIIEIIFGTEIVAFHVLQDWIV